MVEKILAKENINSKVGHGYTRELFISFGPKDTACPHP